MNAFLLLSLSIICEIFATTMLKYSAGFTVLLPSLCVALGYGLAFYFLSLTLKTMPLGLAYAIWSGVGTAATAIIGIFLWQDPFTSYSFLGMSLIILGVVFLNKAPHPETPPPKNGS